MELNASDTCPFMEENSRKGMIEMAKVYEFPRQRKLPAGMERGIKKIAKEYVEVLYATMALYELTNDRPSNEELQKLVEVAFAEGILEAVDDLDES